MNFSFKCRAGGRGPRLFEFLFGADPEALKQSLGTFLGGLKEGGFGMIV